MKETHMSIFIKKSRADVFREYCWMHLSKLKSALCQMKLFKKYIEATKIKESQEKFIFRQICHSKQVCWKESTQDKRTVIDIMMSLQKSNHDYHGSCYVIYSL